MQPGIVNPVAPSFTLGEYIADIVSFIIIVAFLASFFLLVWGGFSWLTSGGNPDQVEAARNKIVQAFIGLLIVVSAWVIFGVVSTFFDIDFTNFNLPQLGN